MDERSRRRSCLCALSFTIMIFLSAIFIPVSNSGRSGTQEIIDEGEMKLQHLSQGRTRSTGVVYNMSYVHDSGSLYDIGYDTYVNITSEYVLNGSLGPFEISPNSLIPLFGYFNNNDLLDVFLIKTNITINGTLYSFAIFGYFDFYNNYSELNFTDYDLLILGQRNVTYAGNYVWVYYNFGYGFISPYGYEKYFINNAIYLGDINSDGYADLIILSYKNTTSKRFERYLSQYGALLLYSAREYKNGTISIIYGGSATSPGVIHCDRGESGTHPDKVVEGVPSTVPGYGMDVVDVDGDGRLDLVYTEKRYEKADPSFCNITIFVMKDINNVSNGAEFDDVVDITIHWTSGKLDSISTIMEYPTKVIAANLDGNGIPDLIFVEYGYVPPIVGIYDFNLLPGVYSMENIMDFSFEFPSGGGRSNLDYILGLDVARLNYDAIDDICTWGAVWITNPANKYSGNYYIPDPAFVFDTRYSTQKFDGPGMVYTYEFKYDFDDDGYRDILRLFMPDTTFTFYLGIVKAHSRNFTVRGDNIRISPENTTAYYINPFYNVNVSTYLTPMVITVIQLDRNNDSSKRLVSYLSNDGYFSYAEINDTTDMYSYEYWNFSLTFFTLPDHPNTPPEVTNVSATPEVLRGNLTSVYITINDDHDRAGDLYFEMEYRPPGGEWTKAEQDYEVLNATTIRWDIQTSLDDELGYYDIRLKVYDCSGFAREGYTYRQRVFRVVDNPPAIITASYESKITYRDGSTYKILIQVADVEDDVREVQLRGEWSINASEWLEEPLTVERMSYQPDTFVATLTLNTDVPVGTYSFRFQAVDSDNVSSPWYYVNGSLMVKNYNPLLEDFRIRPQRIYRGESAEIQVSGHDTESPPASLRCLVQYRLESWSVWRDLDVVYNTSRGRWSGTFSTDSETEKGMYVFRVAFLDPDGGNSSWYTPSSKLQVMNNPPEVLEDLEYNITNLSAEIDLSPYGWDYEDDGNITWYVLTYSTTPEILESVEIRQNNILRISAKENVSGDVDVELQAEDSDGDSSSMTLHLHVNTMSRFVGIHGRVTLLNAPEGITPEGFLIVVYDEEGGREIIHIQVGEDGTFSAYGIPRGGVYSVKILPPENLTYQERVRSGFEPLILRNVKFSDEVELNRELRWKTTYIPPKQYNVTVVVKDSRGNPVKGASVRINETGAVRTTDDEGRVTFGGLSEGGYTIYITADGYKPISIHCTVPEVLNYSVNMERIERRTSSGGEKGLDIKLITVVLVAVIAVVVLAFYLMKRRGGEGNQEVIGESGSPAQPVQAERQIEKAEVPTGYQAQ